MYLFHGAPDMLISMKKDRVRIMDSDEEVDDMDSIVHLTTVYPLESNLGSSDEEGIVEVARGSIPMT